MEKGDRAGKTAARAGSEQEEEGTAAGSASSAWRRSGGRLGVCQGSLDIKHTRVPLTV